MAELLSTSIIAICVTNISSILAILKTSSSINSMILVLLLWICSQTLKFKGIRKDVNCLAILKSILGE